MVKQNSIDFFAPALETMEQKLQTMYVPENYIEYRKRFNLPERNTAQVISINSLSQLSSLSQKAIQENAMVLRLGSPSGMSGTQFTVVKSPASVNDFFLVESEMFFNLEETFIPTSSLRDLFTFELLPSFTENTLVNLALESGLIHQALKLDPHTKISSAITGYKSTFEFKFRPHSSIQDICHHYPGQIEIDAAFLGRRNGKECLFVIEAKSYKADTLAKHKLLYPVMALLSSKRIPRDVEIIPVYMKASKTSWGWNFNFVECSLPDPRKELASLDKLVAKPDTHVNMTLPMFVDKSLGAGGEE